MPQTYRDYPVYTIAVQTYSNALTDGDMTRYQAGDIVAKVRQLSGIGFRELKDFIWLNIQGWDSSLVDRLMDEITTGSQPDPLYVDEADDQVILELARYCIPLESMGRILPGFSVARATDPNDIYQPFMMTDQGNVPDLATTYYTVEVDAAEWLPTLIDDPVQLQDALASLEPGEKLKLERTLVEPEFAEAVLDAGVFLITHPPIDPDGLIFDKLTQRYLYG